MRSALEAASGPAPVRRELEMLTCPRCSVEMQFGEAFIASSVLGALFGMGGGYSLRDLEFRPQTNTYRAGITPGCLPSWRCPRCAGIWMDQV